MPLFEGIISDLFPGVKCPKPDYGVFMEALKENIAKRQLQAVPWFLDKIIQVNDKTFSHLHHFYDHKVLDVA